MSRRQSRHSSGVASELVFNGNLIRDLKGPRSYEDVAHGADVSLRTVQRWVAGTSKPYWRQLVRLADTLNVDPYDFYVAHDEEQAA